MCSASVHSRLAQALKSPDTSSLSWCFRAWNAGQSLQALNSYSAALEECGSAPPAFVAVLHCNRAAALHKLRKFTDAISDCLCAIALSPAYNKVRRRHKHRCWWLDCNTERAGEMDMHCVVDGQDSKAKRGETGFTGRLVTYRISVSTSLKSPYQHE
jgi:hypothetical protein